MSEENSQSSTAEVSVPASETLALPVVEKEAVYATDLVYFGWTRNLLYYEMKGVINPRLHQQVLMNCHLLKVADDAWLYDILKNLTHRVAVLMLMPILLPLFCLVAILIKLDSKGPVVYSQIRIGRFGAPFHLYKFRTMIVDAERVKYMQINEMESTLFKQTKDPRITRMGKILRRWSIDETLQFYNVLRGDMDLIGPRPYPPEDTVTTDDAYLNRFAVRPGITGLWQCTVRESMDGRLKMKLDSDYVAKRGWLTDIAIVWKTIAIVLSGRGAY